MIISYLCYQENNLSLTDTKNNAFKVRGHKSKDQLKFLDDRYLESIHISFLFFFGKFFLSFLTITKLLPVKILLATTKFLVIGGFNYY